MLRSFEKPEALVVTPDFEEGERIVRFLSGLGVLWRWFVGMDEALNHMDGEKILVVDQDPQFVGQKERERWLETARRKASTVVALARYGSSIFESEGVFFLRKPVDYRELERLLHQDDVCGRVGARTRRRVETQFLRIRRLDDINRQVVEGMPLAVAVVDEDMRIVFANNLLWRLTGIAEDAQGTSLAEVMHENLLGWAEFERRFKEVIEEGESHRLLQMVYQAEGMPRMLFDIWIRRLPVDPPQALIVIDDVTESVKQKDVLTMLRKVAQDVRGTLELERVLFTILTCITAGEAIGFTRAFLLLVDDKERILRGRMGVGPMDAEEAKEVWEDLSRRGARLEELIAAYDRLGDRREVLHLDRCGRLLFSLEDDETLPVAALAERRTFIVRDGHAERPVRKELLQFLGTDNFVVVPVLAKGHVLGAVLADNRFSSRPITNEQVELLETFTSQAALAIDTAEAYRQLEEKVEELQKAYRELEEAQKKVIQTEQLAAVGRMAARVAHEIRNPLVTIGGFARMIHKSPESAARVRTNAHIIVQEVKRLENILSELMSLARPAPPVLELHNINRLCDEIVRQEKNRLAEREIELLINTDESLPEILVDAAKIKQVLLNLVRNAEAAIEEMMALDPEHERRIIISTHRETDNAVIEVEDTGRGIPENLHDRVFEPFFTTRSGGTGLGLPISRRIVEEHGGTISFRSSYGKGTRFIIRLPMRR